MSDVAVTWWGHATATVELGGVRVLTDPVLVGRLAHLRRVGATPPPVAREAELVLVSHLHLDHLHVPSLRSVSPDARIVVPRGTSASIDLRGLDVVEAVPGEELVLDLGPDRLTVEVTAADHPATRHRFSHKAAPALGFRVSSHAGSFWYPGDTGPHADVSGLEAVDLALVPVGGWGPTLGSDHVGPSEAAALVRRVGAAAAIPVHWGTFWPLGLGRVMPDRRHHLLETPGERFLAAARDLRVAAGIAVPGRRTSVDAIAARSTEAGRDGA